MVSFWCFASCFVWLYEMFESVWFTIKVGGLWVSVICTIRRKTLTKSFYLLLSILSYIGMPTRGCMSLFPIMNFFCLFICLEKVVCIQKIPEYCIIYKYIRLYIYEYICESFQSISKVQSLTYILAVCYHTQKNPTVSIRHLTGHSCILCICLFTQYPFPSPAIQTTFSVDR